MSEIEAYARGRMDEQQGTYCNQRTPDSIVSFLSLFLSLNLHHAICTCFDRYYFQAACFKAIRKKHGEDYDWQNAAIDRWRGCVQGWSRKETWSLPYWQWHDQHNNTFV